MFQHTLRAIVKPHRSTQLCRRFDGLLDTLALRGMFACEAKERWVGAGDEGKGVLEIQCDNCGDRRE
jgi:hypothetical protein